MKRFSSLISLTLVLLLGTTAFAQSQSPLVYHAYDFTGKTNIAGFGVWEFRSLKDDLFALAERSPQIARVVSLGHSHEGRQIWAIKISDDVQTEDLTEPEALFIGAQHAREWISVEVPFLIAQYLVQNYESDERIKRLIDNLEIWIVPMVNPDGHEYTRSDPCPTAPQFYCRLWRKNRRDLGNNIFGVDPNRNWGYQWDSRFGGSRNPQSFTYRGPEPFSEPETQAIRNLVTDPRRRFKAFIDYHSYSQIVGAPWAYDLLQPVPLSEDMRFSPPSDALAYTRIVQTMAQLIKSVHGAEYDACQISLNCPYPAGGVSGDWVYSVTGGMALLVELRPRTSEPGFVLPPEQILPTFEENLPAALFLLEQALVELVIRDSSEDNGSVPTAEGRLSPDIRVDAPPYGVVNATGSAFDERSHEEPMAGAVNRVYVTVHHRGLTDVEGAVVELYWANTLESGWTWPNSAWNPVDNDDDPANGYAFRHFVSIRAGESVTVSFSWLPPSELPHGALLARVRHLQDPVRLLQSSSDFDLLDNNIAARRVQVMR
ncbi:MAG: M14 family zinc carboxypeptidase [Candidatus Bipolaricaulota bacterium]|nr:M14 family zinc carboxypeptidase [Candidatus Bipolaricaulota bacterium]MCS7274258.1 M14 family zinc carboxypeptidase [Candidatus Bipolaricaulota bacterium]MDW8111042.1 M14 family zinc carboxypeptidase [Candidatus Bipolaricaulota bacterium]MDW8329771.1 M14 family zinc carboxypeptidase [Candidatus Bipolaricaulota bacterium]